MEPPKSSRAIGHRKSPRKMELMSPNGNAQSSGIYDHSNYSRGYLKQDNSYMADNE